MAKQRLTYLWPLLVAIGVAVVTGATARLPEPRSPWGAETRAIEEGLSSAVERVNSAFHHLWDKEGIEPASRADDLTILRRLSLALLGTIPSLEEIRAFEADSRPDRLERWTATMLEDDRFASYFAERLARSYVGVEGGQFLIFRRDRFSDWLETQLREHRPYDEIVRSMISSQGVWTGQGEVNFATAAFANDEFDVNKLTARTVRAFLGQRIDCAQCHDHPFDHWKQSEFEGLAAHFGQIQLSLAGVVDHPHLLFKLNERASQTVMPGPVQDAMRDQFGRQKQGLVEDCQLRLAGENVWLVEESIPAEGASDQEASMMMETGSALPTRRIRFVIRKAGDEFEVHERQGEYFVNDRDSQEDRLVEPAVPFHPEWLPVEGTRREKLAAWVTHPQNQRFERAVANRVWGILFGKPYLVNRPVDDLPDPDVNDETTEILNMLGEDFRTHGYNLRRMIQAITATEAFRMESVHPLTSQVETAELNDQEVDHLAQQIDHVKECWAVFPLIRLRPEQVIGGMLQSSFVRTIDQNSHLITRFVRFIRERDFVNAFGDPGVDELSDRAGTIPQALLRMNGEFAAELSKATPFSAAGRIGMIAGSSKEVIEAIYLACLTRRPSADELEYFLKHSDIDKRGEVRNNAIQDLVWTLFNSPEFSWNH